MLIFTSRINSVTINVQIYSLPKQSFLQKKKKKIFLNPWIYTKYRILQIRDPFDRVRIINGELTSGEKKRKRRTKGRRTLSPWKGWCNVGRDVRRGRDYVRVVRQTGSFARMGVEERGKKRLKGREEERLRKGNAGAGVGGWREIRSATPNFIHRSQSTAVLPG